MSNRGVTTSMELARGTTADRPWGMTLFALARREHSGELVIRSELGVFRVAFRHGGIVGAKCPRQGELASRVAAAGGFLTAACTPEANRRIDAAPARDPVEIIAELERLTPDRATRLRRRVIAQAAARTFAIESGQFTVTSDPNPLAIAGHPIDVRAVVLLAARTILTPARIADALAPYGNRFVLSADAAASLPRFGLTDADRPVLEALAGGIGLGDVVPGVDARGVHAVVYALVTCLACSATTATAGAHRLGRGTPMLSYSASASGSDSGLAAVAVPPPVAAFRRGQAALDRDELDTAVVELSRAVELDPNAHDYQAVLAWARFRGAADKHAIAPEIRNTLSRVILRSNKPEAARFFLGRIERMLGRDREALRHFQAVLDNQPGNKEAAAEVRVLEQRLTRR